MIIHKYVLFANRYNERVADLCLSAAKFHRAEAVAYFGVFFWATPFSSQSIYPRIRLEILDGFFPLSYPYVFRGFRLPSPSCLTTVSKILSITSNWLDNSNAVEF